ncbi:MAG: hypothetical protein L0J63_12865 [Tetragenococcus koreensis]|nr:hypothetical protein [Tetragenococcus koreensis]
MNKRIKKIFNKDELIRYLWRKITKKGLLNFLSDESFVRLEYKLKMKEELNLESPERYNEKLQWLKLYDHDPLYTDLVDKFEVRKHVEKLIGKDYLIPSYGVYNDYDEIDFDSLPDQFVLKPTHASGDVFLCKDKSTIDHQKLKKEIDRWLHKNYYNYHREWPYKNVKPRIVCEKFMIEQGSDRIKDYKFFCFNGKAEYMFVASDRGTNTKFDFYDREFNHLNLKQHYLKSDTAMPKPANYEKMLKLSEQLSVGFPHVRIDFYSINGRIYFGEFTFYHFSGFEAFVPDSFDFKLGSLLKLPQST